MSQLVRILAIAFLVAFATGSATNAAALSDMSLKMSMTTMDDSASDCQDCPGDHGQVSACDLFCVTPLFVIWMPLGTDLPEVTNVVAHGAGASPAGHAGPPDPYPPRTNRPS